jgi:uncharacterized protein (TIGR03089 family)
VTPYQLLRAATARNAARPLVTFYDDATGERVELSVATFDNWVAKTANLLQDGLSVEPGERAAVALPVHWQTLVVVIACWAAGVVVVPAAADAEIREPVDVAFAGPPALGPATRAAGREVVGLSLLPLGRPLGPSVAGTPAGTDDATGLVDLSGVVDYAAEVPAHGDRFAAYAPPTDTDPAVDAGGDVLSHGDVVARAGELATASGWPAGVRLMVTREVVDLETLLATAVVPLAVDGSVVLCRNADRAALGGRRAAERVTADLD